VAARRHDRQIPPGSTPSLLAHVAALSTGHHFLRRLVKDPAIIEAAYDDVQGVTAESTATSPRMNRELGRTSPDAFDHVAFFDRRREWVDAPARTAADDVCVNELDLQVNSPPARSLRTEISAKFTRRRIERDFAAAD